MRAASKLPEMSEAQFQRLVIETATLYGWRVQHSRTARISRGDGSVRYATALAGQVGFPDLVLARAGRIIYVELKVGRNRPTVAQVDWLNALSGAISDATRWVSRDEVPGFGGGAANLVVLAYPRHWAWLRDLLRRG